MTKQKCTLSLCRYLFLNNQNFYTMSNLIITNQDTNITPSADLANIATPKTKQVTQRTIDRRTANKDVRCAMLNFTDVFKYVRKDVLFLPNRVKMSHIDECNVFLTKYFAQYCRENLALKMSEKIYLDRLPLLTTDIQALKCFLTKSQLANFSARAWSFTDIVDTLVKAITLPTQTYQACLAQKGKI